MKSTIYSLLIVSLFGLSTIGCKKSDDNNKQLTITGQLTDNSECKNNLKSNYQIIEMPDSISSIEYSFDKENNKLTLKHINAGFNCCTDSLYCEVQLNGDTIQIKELENNPHCYCECLYDLDIEINGVDIKNYQIKIIEPYVNEQANLTFSIDLTKVSNGSYSVIRKEYPWGMESINE